MKECEQFGVGTRKYDICCHTAAGLTPEQMDSYREMWGLPRLHPVAQVEQCEAPVPELKFLGRSVSEHTGVVINKLYGPGSELLAIYKAAGVPVCDACTKLAQDMNNWGVTECKARVEEIVADILPRALEWLENKYSWCAKLFPDAGVAMKIRSDVNKAITTAETTIVERKKKKLDIYTGNKVSGCSGCGSGTVTPGAVRIRQNANLHPFAMGQAPARFITLEQYAIDVRKLLSLVPTDIDCVAGVARSGLFPASMVAMWLHKPMIIVSQSSGQIVEAGNGWRLAGKHEHITPKTNKVLVVDDTVMTGGSQQIIRRVVGSRFPEVVYATVYCNPRASLGKPDIHAVDLEWPHLLEWNLFNSVVSKSTAVDFDGILCHDCRPDQDDDGPNYLDFIRNAKPLYLPRKEPLPLIVTARVEKYREETVKWLRRHGVRFNKLVMHPAASTRERERDNIPAYKARHFKEWARVHRPTPGPTMFIESEDWQARQIAQLSGYMSVCPATAKVYQNR